MFRTLHYLNEVYKEQSFSRAAQKLYLSQPSLSLTIKKFEQNMGVQIFDRSTTPIQLTDAGKVYMDGVQKILAIENEMDTFLDDYKKQEVGNLTLGAAHMFSCLLMPPLIASFLQLYPKISVRLVEGDFLSLQEAVLKGEIDLLIESQEFDEELFRSYPLFKERALLAVPKSDPVNARFEGMGLSVRDVCASRYMDADCPCVPLKAFQKHRFLVLERGHDMRMRTLRLCRACGFEPQMYMVLNQLMTVYSLTNQQLGVSFVTDTAVKLGDKDRNLIFYKIDDEQSIRTIYIACKRNRYVSRPMQAFIDMMLELSSRDLIEIASPGAAASESGG